MGKSPLPSCCWYPRNLQQDRSWTEPGKNLSIYIIARSQLTSGSVGKVPFNLWWTISSVSRLLISSYIINIDRNHHHHLAKLAGPKIAIWWKTVSRLRTIKTLNSAQRVKLVLEWGTSEICDFCPFKFPAFESKFSHVFRMFAVNVWNLILNNLHDPPEETDRDPPESCEWWSMYRI